MDDFDCDCACDCDEIDLGAYSCNSCECCECCEQENCFGCAGCFVGQNDEAEIVENGVDVAAEAGTLCCNPLYRCYNSMLNWFCCTTTQQTTNNQLATTNATATSNKPATAGIELQSNQEVSEGTYRIGDQIFKLTAV